MEKLPKRKQIRMPNYNYSNPGSYFITVCTANKTKILWDKRAYTMYHKNIPLSQIGKIVEQGILQIADHYANVLVEKYCVMPNHIHIILRIKSNNNGQMISAPTISTIIGSMKQCVSKKYGKSIWQKSFYEHLIRNHQEYIEIWRYIDNNPLKYLAKIHMQKTDIL